MKCLCCKRQATVGTFCAWHKNCATSKEKALRVAQVLIVNHKSIDFISDMYLIPMDELVDKKFRGLEDKSNLQYISEMVNPDIDEVIEPYKITVRDYNPDKYRIEKIMRLAA